MASQPGFPSPGRQAGLIRGQVMDSGPIRGQATSGALSDLKSMAVFVHRRWPGDMWLKRGT